MRILFVSSMSILPWGGSEKLWSQAAQCLVKKGYEVWSSQPGISKGHPATVALADSGIRTTYRRPKQGRFVGLMKRMRPEIPSLINQVKPDLVVISQGNNKDGEAWMHYCAANQIPFAVIVQCNSELWFPADRIRKKLRDSYKTAEAVYCVSQQNLEILKCQLGYELPNAKVVFNPQQLDSESVLGWPMPSDTVRMACVARMDPVAKGHDILAQVMAMPKWRERNVQVSPYGSGPYEGGIRELVDYLNADKIRFCGQVGSYQQIWAENEILLMPSRFEGMSLALLESMWCGRPSVVTACGGGAAEVVVEGESGFFASAATPELFDAAMERAWEKRSQWQAMGQRARQICEERVPADPSGAFAAEVEVLIK